MMFVRVREVSWRIAKYHQRGQSIIRWLDIVFRTYLEARGGKGVSLDYIQVVRMDRNVLEWNRKVTKMYDNDGEDDNDDAREGVS